MHGNATSEISLLLIIFSAVVGLPSVKAGGTGSSMPAEGNDALQQRALILLRDSLQREDRWIKVHAAESLLSLGQSQEVRQAFELELASKGGEPKYRIGIWRVLAQAAPDVAEREQWIGKIRAAFLDPTGPDRLHAAESMAKLGYQVQAREADAFKLIAETGSGPLAVNTRWILANSGASNEQLSLVKLLESKEADTRFDTAYAFRNLPHLSAPAREKLLSALINEPTNSNDRIYMISAALVHAPPDQQKHIKVELLSHVKTGDQSVKYEICATLAKVGQKEDLPLLSSLLDDTNSDVRVGAAGAVLRIERRNSHPDL
jgi:solute:Na+ symporter, SSS family